MTKYYKQINENGELVTILTYDFEPTISDPLTVELTAEEYEALVAELRANAKHEPSAEQIERMERQKEKTLKAKAYDIITGVAE